MLSLVLTEKQTIAVEKLAIQGVTHSSGCSEKEWGELVQAGYCYYLDYFYYHHETYATPDFEMCEPDKRGSTSEEADRQFEEGRWYLFEEGKLQL